MPPNPIVEEIHEIRQQILAQFDNDIHAYIEYCRQRDAEDDRPTVSFPPRRPPGWSQEVAEKVRTSSEQTQRDLFAALARLRQLHPEWRLGQTMANVVMTAGRTSANGVWDLEDEEALAAARRLIEQSSEVGSDVA